MVFPRSQGISSGKYIITARMSNHAKHLPEAIRGKLKLFMVNNSGLPQDSAKLKMQNAKFDARIAMRSF